MLSDHMDCLDHPAIRAPVPRSSWALFLDIDGTLIDIAPQPDAVVVPEALIPTLEAASAWLGDALAVVSGRPLSAIDRLLGPLRLPCASEHGAVVRLHDGTLLSGNKVYSVPAHWRERIRSVTGGWPGIIVGDKTYSVAIHYRQAPERERDVRELANRLVAEDPGFEVLPASMAYEIRHRSFNKAEAVNRLMAYPPFAGRIPVFVGDDVTDEDGFRAARAMGGLGLHVNASFGGKPSEVRRWLKSFAEESADNRKSRFEGT